MPDKFYHKGIEISVGTVGTFEFTLGEGSGYESYDTLKQAQDRIDRLHRAQNASVNLDLKVLMADGKEYLLRKMHRGTGHWITDPKIPDRFGLHYCYMPTDENRALIAEYTRLQAEVERVGDELRKHQIRLEASFYGSDKVDRIEAFERQFAEEYQRRLGESEGK